MGLAYNLSPRFDQPAHSWSEVIALIQRTESGRTLLLDFFPQVQKGGVRVSFYPVEIRSRLLSHTSPVGGCFVIDGNQGTIYLDAQCELGILTPYFFHEMVHALDPTLWEISRKPFHRATRERLLFEAEYRAFQAQHVFQEELKRFYPELRAMHQTRYPEITFLNREISRREIQQLYLGVF